VRHHQKQQQVVAFARQHRSRPTESEARLWRELRGGALGVVFRRQVVIGGYIADFAAAAARLVVEVDGGCHAGRRVADARREEKLERAGWRVVRVTAEGVMAGVEAVVAAIAEAVRGRALR